jgi:hypothetical protein
VSNVWMMEDSMNWIGCELKRTWPNLMHYLGIYQHKLIKTAKNLGQNSIMSLDRELNSGPTAVPHTRSRGSAFIIVIIIVIIDRCGRSRSKEREASCCRQTDRQTVRPAMRSA